MAKEKIKVANKTGIASLDAIIKASSQQLGTDLSGHDYGNLTPFTTGSLQLDLALKIGGLPEGRIIEVIGQESSMKTSFCLFVIGLKQKARLIRNIELEAEGTEEALGLIDERRDLIIDLEHTLTRDFIEGFGIDMDQIIWIRPKSAEEALQVSIDYVKSGAIDTVLVDSVDAMQNEKQQRRKVGETDVGGISKDMSFAIRQIAKLAPEYNTTYLFINQIRMNPGVMFGSPETTPGGKSLSFYASLRLKCMRREKCPDIPNATMFRVKIIKTKLGGDYTEQVKVPFVFGRGFAQALDIEGVAKDFGLLRHSAGQSKVNWHPDDPDASEPLLPNIGKGKSFGQQALINNPWLLEKLRQLCFYVANADNKLPLEAIQAMGPPTVEESLLVQPAD